MDSIARIMYEAKQPENFLKTIATGIDDFDTETAFLCRGKLSVLGARPGMGKTSAAIQIARSAASREMSVVWISTDLSSRQTVARFTERGLSGSARKNIFIEDRNAEVESICEAIRRMEKRTDLVVVDRLQGLYRISRRGNAVFDHAECCAMLRSLARDTDAALLLLSGVRRTAERRKGNMPCCEDIFCWEKIKGSIDNACVFLHDGYYDDETDNIVNAEFVFQPSVDRCCRVWTWWDRSKNEIVPIRG